MEYKLIKQFNKKTIDALKELGFRVEYNMMYRDYFQEFKLVLDFADNSVDVARVKGKDFYMSMQNFDDLNAMIKRDLEILKLKGIIE